MQIIRSMLLAFSTYSIVPVPQLAWKEEDMRYSMCFFPWVGAATGALVWGWVRLALLLGVSALAYVPVACALPLLFTGGIHADGFMDTCDAFHSYAPRERKLEILKDAHIGAFSVICLAEYGLLYLAAFSQITESRVLMVYCCGFFFSRCLSGLGVVSLPSAKQDGMLYRFASAAHARRVRCSLLAQALLCAALMLWLKWDAALLVLLGALLAAVYCSRRCRRTLGGITGDTAGWFLLLCEGAMAIMAAVSCLYN